MLNGWAHARARSQMRDGVELFAVKQVSHGGIFAKIDMMNRNVLRNFLDVCAFDLRIVKIVEVIEDGDAVPGRE